MNVGNTQSTVWVIFEQSNYKHWIFRWINKDFQHCYCMKKSHGGQYWAVINGRRSNLQVDIEPLELYPTVRDYAGNSAKIVKVELNIDPLQAVQHLSIISCVDVCKAVLGLQSFWIWTPYQLFKRLTK